LLKSAIRHPSRELNIDKYILCMVFSELSVIAFLLRFDSDRAFLNYNPGLYLA
jgi:hypothetical protein